MKHLILHVVYAVAYHSRTWGTANYNGPPPPKEVADDVLALLFSLVAKLRHAVEVCKIAHISALLRFKGKKAAAEAPEDGEHSCSDSVVHADLSQGVLTIASQAWLSMRPRHG